MIQDVSNFELYADPAGYDIESGVYEPDDSILLQLALQANGPVLEIGCGTGRVTVPLAERGIQMTGLDLLPHLIEHAKSKAHDLPIRWVCQDARTFQLDTRFPLIFSKGAVFNHLLTRHDQEAMFSRVRQHLASGGMFIIDAIFKHPKNMVSASEAQEWHTFTDDQGRDIRVSGTDHYDHLQQIWYQTSTQSWQEQGRTKRRGPVQLSLRYVFPQEMEALLIYNGFQLLSRYGDWQGAPLSEESNIQVYLCTIA